MRQAQTVRIRWKKGTLRAWAVRGAAAFSFFFLLLWQMPAGADARLPVRILYQNPALPNGCEVTSLAMVLASVGAPADKVALYEEYLPKADFSVIDGVRYGPDPEKWYAGDAASRSGGWYCMEAPIRQAADGWLRACGSTCRARSVTGLDRGALDAYAHSGTPVIVWVTLRYEPPRRREAGWLLEDGTPYDPYTNLHCVVLAGEKEDAYRVADPLRGFVCVEKDTFWESFSAMGCRAVVIE